MDKLKLSKYLFTPLLFICLSACSEEDDDTQDNLTLADSVIILTPEDPITTLPPINLIPILTLLTGLSADYDEYYSGYWKGSLCGGNEEAVIGVNGDTVELNTNAHFMTPMFGSIDSLGSLTFTPRQVNWDTEIYGDVRPLETFGIIDRESKTGYIHFEVACSSGALKYTISTITINLKSGSSQPSPYNELVRIKGEAIDLIGSSVQSCTDEAPSQCKTFNIDSNDDFCNFSAIAYSTTVTDENILSNLKNEYRRNKWLSTTYTSDSSTTYCGYYLNATCEENICVMR